MNLYQKIQTLAVLLGASVWGQAQNSSPRLTDGVTVAIEASGTVSTGDFAPLWLSANRQGKISALDNSAYERVMLWRDSETDSLRNWHFGYGLDFMARQNSPSAFLVHQAYVQAAWKKIGLTLGPRERCIDLRNNELTSGGLSQGINATPIPEAIINVDYFTFPGTKGWWQWKGRIGYGMTTDGRWQKRWIGDASSMHYSSSTFFHEKAIYWKFGREDRFPLTYEIGLQMMAQFGGTSYNVIGRGVDGSTPLHNPQGLKAFWHAFAPMGSYDVTDGAIHNAEGNTVGSYNMRLQWKQQDWSVGAYFERFFEDQSMLTVQYGIYDHLLGVDAQLPKNPVVSHIVVEHLSTKDQSGPVYHDATANLPYHIAGNDNYYNHNIYTGWQHWGMAIGHPLISSPVYNADHQLIFRNNRVMAWHIGLDGAPCPQVHWRALATFTRNWGTYEHPFAEEEREQHVMAEAGYQPTWAAGWQGVLGVGLSHGALIGNTFGAQLTIRKSFKL